ESLCVKKSEGLVGEQSQPESYHIAESLGRAGKMICKHCGARTSEGESRCGRCGRKPDDTLNEVILPRTKGALAAKLQPAPLDDSAEITSPKAQLAATHRPLGPTDDRKRTSVPRQASLFVEKPSSNVIPIQTYAPIPVAEPPGPRQPA